jgi:serine/threonine protein kinase
LIGRVIGNTYRIVEKIGQGGMGAVYRAVDEVLEREVAVKAVRPDLAREKEIVDRFRQEARTLARVSHPAIATIYNFLQEGDELFLVMELVRGRTLADVLRTEGALPWQRAVSLLASALDGIERAHRMGIIHRDLKPENLMLTEDGTLKVMDFGIARAVGSGHLTRTGLLIGTLRYIAPEQIRGEEVDRRTDIYSLGIVLYEMLAGRVPFEGGNDYAILRAQIEDPPTPPVFHVPDLPAWLDRAVLKALAKDREERYQTVEELRSVLASRGTAQGPEDYLDATLPLREDQTRITFRTPPPSPVPSPATTAGPPPPPRLAPSAPQTTAASVIPPAAPSPPISAGSYGAVGLNRSGSGTWKLVLGAALVVVLVIAGTLLWLGKRDGEAQRASEAAPAPEANPDSTVALPAAPGDSEPQPAGPREPGPEDTPQSPTASRQPSPPSPRTLPPAPNPTAPPADEPAAADSDTEPAPSEEEKAGTFQPVERPEELPADELKRIGGELQAGTARLFASFQAHLERKDEAGQEITDDDEQLEEDLEALMGSAERFNEGLQGGGVLARLRRRSAGDMEPIRRRVQRLTERAQRVDALVARLDTGPEVKNQWQEVRSRWRRAVQILE